MFIVIEGLDGTGKSTIAKALATDLKAELLSTPDQSLSAARKDIDNAYEGNPYARQLFYASTVVHLSDKIKDLQLQGKTVVIDRYWLSTQVYHSWKCNDKHYRLAEIENHIQTPDFTIYLKLPLATRTLRLGSREENTVEDNLTLKKDVDDTLNQTYDSYKKSSIAGQWIEVDVSEDIESIIGVIKKKIEHSKMTPT